MTSDSLPTILYFQTPQPLIPIAESLLSLTPKVFVIGKDIYADIETTHHLFGGVQKVLEKAEAFLSLFNSSPDWVLTEKINWAKALCLKNKNIYKKGESHKLLLSLPIESLALCGSPLLLQEQAQSRNEMVQLLRKVGVVFCGDFLNLPTTSISHRFGSLGTYLIRALQGNDEPVLSVFDLQESIRFSVDTESLASVDALLYEIDSFLPQLEARLQGRKALVKTLRLGFSLENKQKESQTLALSHFTRDPKTLRTLLQEVLSKVSWSAPLHNFSLEVTEAINSHGRQLSLLDSTEDQLEELSTFVRRMKIQHGDMNVGFPAVLPSHLPELSWTLNYPPVPSSAIYPDKNRPLFIFSQPIPFHPNAQWRLTETERLTLFWWSESLSRRYFSAENSAGEKLWVFWDSHTKKWFCHGSFD